MTYRLTRGIRDEEVPMAVGCMRMVDAVSGGVVYSRNPVNVRDETVVVNSVWGLPKSVVDGVTIPDIFLVSRSEPPQMLDKEIAFKDKKYMCFPDEGVCRLEMTDEECSKPSLTDGQVFELARLAMRLEVFFGMPQDIEWAMDNNRSIIILHSRPLQQMENTRREEAVGTSRIKVTPLIKGGVNASPGVAHGPVFVVKKDADLLRFPDGAVLMTLQALPRWAPLLPRASAVITEQGSIAGHLAHVAREYRIPALFGVRDVIQRLETGQEVTVDADGHCIYDGRIEALLNIEPPPKNYMQGSPVFESLKGAARHIIPLTLLDPDAPSFSPANCRTMHDITRFCHEKSVREMFRFGKDHHFPERSGKQLICEVPMQWWVLNLDDGFKEEVSGNRVRLENIVSIPMLALWEGIVAHPWEGPPPVDGKGFMSVMFEATRNPALVPGMKSNYGNRNYFMISKNYCSLSSRLGFHFSMVEALVSQRSVENYISFQFKGGAADDNRRQKRILFIADILEEVDFRVQVKEDHLVARMENHDTEYMKTHLKILGYLTIHTRQLDMIMSNSASVSRYRSKIEGHIRGMLAAEGSNHEVGR
jgi:pyruvate,water dikinase